MNGEDVDFVGLRSNTIGLDHLCTSMSATEMGVGANILTVIVSVMLSRFGEYSFETVETHGCQ